MIVVADTSPINYLVLIGHIEILPKIYGEVLVPQAVIDELQDRDAPTAVRDWLSAPPKWLRISSMTFQPDPLLDRLDRGERDAIMLAEAISADRLIMDDLDGRREAENRKLAVIGTLGIMAEAARRRLLVLSEALAALQATNFHVSPALIERLLAKEAERRR
jgi:predicted nucleic acid-binding protein